MKKTYVITYTEEIVHTFYVDADDEHEAASIFNKGLNYGEYDFSDGELVDSTLKLEEDNSCGALSCN